MATRRRPKLLTTTDISKNIFVECRDVGQNEISTDAEGACNVLEDAREFFDRGESFNRDGDAYAALLYFSLAANSINMFLKFMGPILQRFKCGSTQKQCNDYWKIVNKLEYARNVTYSYIVRLQAKVRQERGAAKGSGGNKDDNQTDCEVALSSLVRFEKGSAECESAWFEYVIGLDRAKEDLRNGFIYPLLYPNLFPSMSRGILLFGPPGTGKTLLAKAAVNELQANGQGCIQVRFFAPSGASMKGKYVGETEQKLENLFNCACSAAQQASQTSSNQARGLAIIFLDEVESVAADRAQDSSAGTSSSVTTLLQLMDGIASYDNVVVMAATNLPWKLDPAFLRRFDTNILVPLPSFDDVLALINQALSRHVKTRKQADQKASSCGRKSDQLDMAKEERKAREGCSKPAKNPTSRSHSWSDPAYVKYMPQLDQEKVIAVAKRCQQEAYSGSDVARLMKDVVRQAAMDAVNNGRFFRIVNPFYVLNDKELPKDFELVKLPDGGVDDSKLLQSGEEVTEEPEEVEVDQPLFIWISTLSARSGARLDQTRMKSLPSAGVSMPGRYKSLSINGENYTSYRFTDEIVNLTDPNVSDLFLHRRDDGHYAVIAEITMVSEQASDSPLFLPLAFLRESQSNEEGIANLMPKNDLELYKIATAAGDPDQLNKLILPNKVNYFKLYIPLVLGQDKWFAFLRPREKITSDYLSTNTDLWNYLDKNYYNWFFPIGEQFYSVKTQVESVFEPVIAYDNPSLNDVKEAAKALYKANKVEGYEFHHHAVPSYNVVGEPDNSALGARPEDLGRSCEDLINDNARFYSWNIANRHFDAAFGRVKSTANKKLVDVLNLYAKNPNDPAVAKYIKDPNAS